MRSSSAERVLQTPCHIELGAPETDAAAVGTIRGLQQTEALAKSWRDSMRAREAVEEASLERPIRVALRRA